MAKKSTSNTDHQEDLNIIQHYTSIHSFAEKEINRVSFHYKLILGFLTLAISVIAFLIYHFYGKSQMEIEAKIQREANTAIAQAKQDIRDSIENYIIESDTFIQRSIKKKFSSPQITKLVKDEALKSVVEIINPFIKNEIESYYRKIISKDLSSYSNLNHSYLKCIDSNDIGSFKYLVNYRNSTKDNTEHDISSFYVQDIINRFYNLKDSLTLSRRFGDKLFEPGEVFDNLSYVVLKSDSIAEDLGIYFGVIRAYNVRHKTHYKGDEFNMILKELGVRTFP